MIIQTGVVRDVLRLAFSIVPDDGTVQPGGSFGRGSALRLGGLSVQACSPCGLIFVQMRPVNLRSRAKSFPRILSLLFLCNGRKLMGGLWKSLPNLKNDGLSGKLMAFLMLEASRFPAHSLFLPAQRMKLCGNRCVTLLSVYMERVKCIGQRLERQVVRKAAGWRAAGIGRARLEREYGGRVGACELPGRRQPGV
ncbi:hypothetical protein D3C81_1082740 [compost metagenome]